MNDAGNAFIRVGTLGELRDRRRMVIGTPGGAGVIDRDCGSWRRQWSEPQRSAP